MVTAREGNIMPIGTQGLGEDTADNSDHSVCIHDIKTERQYPEYAKKKKPFTMTGASIWTE
jgi:hypothetical protein